MRVAHLMLAWAANCINLVEKRKRETRNFTSVRRVHLLRHNNLHNFSILFHSAMIIKYYADDDDDYDYDDDYYWCLFWLTMRGVVAAATSSNRLRQLRSWDLGHAPHDDETETETQNETETGSAWALAFRFYSQFSLLCSSNDIMSRSTSCPIWYAILELSWDLFCYVGYNKLIECSLSCFQFGVFRPNCCQFYLYLRHYSCIDSRTFAFPNLKHKLTLFCGNILWGAARVNGNNWNLLCRAKWAHITYTARWTPARTSQRSAMAPYFVC